jgi:hypothetical protein
VSVTAASGCAWQATSNANWISITGSASGNGAGSVNYSVQANSGSARNGALTIAGQTFTVNQAGANQPPTCPTVTNLNPTSGAVGAPVTITGTNFTGVTSVTFTGNVPVTPNINAAGTQITVTVPSGAMSGPLTISKSGCQPVNTPPFTVTTTPPGNRVVRVVDAGGSPGGIVRVPITIQAQGDEVGLQFSLRFDPALLTNPQAEAGSDAANNRFFEVNPTQTGQGQLGVVLLLRNALAQGTRQIAVVSFSLAASASQSIPISFDDSPTRKRVIDVNSRPLDTAYVAGAVTLGQGFEGDVNDDKTVDIADAQLIISHLVGRRMIQAGPEFQRADCAPKESRGDGRIEVDDALQIILYSVNNELVPAGGPSAPQSTVTFASLNLSQTKAGQARSLRIIQDGFANEQGHSFVVTLDAQGGESALMPRPRETA